MFTISYHLALHRTLDIVCMQIIASRDPVTYTAGVSDLMLSWACNIAGGYNQVTVETS
jgi:hypothetical protein